MSGGMSVVIKYYFSDDCLPVCACCVDCVLGVIFGIIYGCKREHLSGVVIRTLQASCLKPQTFRTHFRTLDSKKEKKTKMQQQRACRPKSLALDTPREAPARTVFPPHRVPMGRSRRLQPRALLLFCGLLRPPSCENHTVVCAAT